MRRCRLIGVGTLGFVLLQGAVIGAQHFDRYRDFELGSAVVAVSALTGTAGSELKALHQRPAVIQELTWRPRYAAGRSATTDIASVDRIVFDFYDDRLYRLTVNYERTQTEGLTDADMVEVLSVVYGSPTSTTAPRRGQSTAPSYDDAGTRIAEWGNASNSVALYRLSSYATTFKLVMTAEPAAALARTAIARAAILDARDAPQREAAREKKEADDHRAAEEKARSTNKGTFRP